MPTNIPKDADISIPHTYGGDQDISGAAITWALLPWRSDWNADLDTLIIDEALITYTTAGGAVVITDGAAGEFTVAVAAADTGALPIGKYYVIARIEVSGDQLGPPAVPVQLVARSE